MPQLPAPGEPVTAPTLVTDGIWIFDDVLPPSDFAALRRHVNDLPFIHAHPGQRPLVWRLRDGEPLIGQNYRSAQERARMSTFAIEPSLARLLDEVEDRSRAIGLVTDPAGFTCASWVYPDGAEIAPHRDSPNFHVGAYTFYLHPEWHASNGGLLIAFDPATAARGGDESEARRLGTPGHGRVILPRPNRLVFLSSRIEHMVTPVVEGPRVSFTGFFYRPEAAERAHQAHLSDRDRAIRIMRQLHQPEEDHDDGL